LFWRKATEQGAVDEVSAAILGGVAAENGKDELTQKPPNTLNLQKKSARLLWSAQSFC